MAVAASIAVRKPARVPACREAGQPISDAHHPIPEGHTCLACRNEVLEAELSRLAVAKWFISVGVHGSCMSLSINPSHKILQ